MKIKTPLIILFLLFHAIFINISYINIYTRITYVLLAICGIYLVLNVRKIDKRYNKLNAYLFIFLFAQIVSSYMTHSIDGMIIAIKMFEAFFIVELLASKKLEKESFNIIFYLLFFYIIINDISLISSGAHLKYGYNEYYMLGNKFTIGLLHIELYLLYMQKIKNLPKKIFKTFFEFLLFALSIFISIKVKCTTTLICNFIVLLMLILPKKIKEVLYNPKVFIIILFVCSFILILYSQILQTQFLQYIIVDVFKKNISLTGRMNIYQYIMPVLKEKLIIGYGYGNSYSILMPLFNAPNTQNGLLEYVFNYGIVVTIYMIFFLYKIIKNINLSKDKIKYFSVLIFVYLLIFISSVEISINLNLFLFLSILTFSIVDKETIKKTEEKNYE